MSAQLHWERTTGSSRPGVSGPALYVSLADFNLFPSTVINPTVSAIALLTSVTPSSKLIYLRMVLGTLKLQLAVTSEGGLGDLSNLAIVLFSLSKAVHSSGEQQGLGSQTSLGFKSLILLASSRTSGK